MGGPQYRGLEDIGASVPSGTVVTWSRPGRGCGAAAPEVCQVCASWGPLLPALRPGQLCPATHGLPLDLLPPAGAGLLLRATCGRNQAGTARHPPWLLEGEAHRHPQDTAAGTHLAAEGGQQALLGSRVPDCAQGGESALPCKTGTRATWAPRAAGASRKQALQAAWRDGPASPA